MPLPYGFMLASDGHIAIDQEKANIVRTVYQQYLSGVSLKGIADFLFSQGIPSPRGKAQWTQAVISELLSNQRYIGPIVRFDDFFMAQGEKGKRSNIDEDTKSAKGHPVQLSECTERPFDLWGMWAQLPAHYTPLWRSGMALCQSSGAWKAVLQTFAIYSRAADQRCHMLKSWLGCLR